LTACPEASKPQPGLAKSDRELEGSLIKLQQISGKLEAG